MNKCDLPARYTIEQKSDPCGLFRYLAVTSGGDLAWCAPVGFINVYASERAAEDYRRFRMGAHADDAVVVRHTVH